MDVLFLLCVGVGFRSLALVRLLSIPRVLEAIGGVIVRGDQVFSADAKRASRRNPGPGRRLYLLSYCYGYGVLSPPGHYCGAHCL